MTSKSDDDAANALRLTALEEFCTHLERTIAELNDVVLHQQQQIAALDARLGRLLIHMDAVSQRLAEERRPEDEKPPHY